MAGRTDEPHAKLDLKLTESQRPRNGCFAPTATRYIPLAVQTAAVAKPRTSSNLKLHGVHGGELCRSVENRTRSSSKRNILGRRLFQLPLLSTSFAFAFAFCRRPSPSIMHSRTTAWRSGPDLIAPRGRSAGDQPCLGVHVAQPQHVREAIK